MNDSLIARQMSQDRSVILSRSHLPTTVQPDYPTWPISLPGPFRVPIPPGMKSINAIRSEQVVALNYDQETGEPVEM